MKSQHEWRTFKSSLPVTNGEAYHEEVQKLEYLAARLKTLLQWLDLSSQGKPLHLCWLREESRRSHRVVASRGREEFSEEALRFVGFFGHKRWGLSQASLDELSRIDDGILLEQAQQSRVLGYSSLELSDGNWGNLVLFRKTGGQAQFKGGALHAYAVHQLAPDYYTRCRCNRHLLQREYPISSSCGRL